MNSENLVREESPTTAVTGPRVAASMPLGFRATLLERGLWAEVHAALEARDLEASMRLEELRRTEWLPLSAHVSLIEAAAQVVGLPGVRSLGTLRTQESTMGGLFPNLLRSWVRSFRDDPGSLARIGPQIWQMAFREAGEFLIDDARPTGVTLRIVGWDALAPSAAWRHVRAGASGGIQLLTGRRATATCTGDGLSTTVGELAWGAPMGS